MQQSYQNISVKHRVYLVRHGLTVSNQSGTIQGFDDPLSETGHAQAKILAERAAQLSFSTLLSSDMPRARDTAGYIATRVQKPVEFLPLLREIEADPDLVGRPFSEYADTWWTEPATLDTHRPPWGSSARTQIERARQVLDHIRSLDTDVLAVTHGAFLSILVTVAMWENPTIDTLWGVYRKFTRSNTGITVLSYGGEDNKIWRLVTWNDHAHLG